MAWLTGSYAYGGGTIGRSDIDITVILDKRFAQLGRQIQMSAVLGFVEDYLRVHARTGFAPDLHFPGEYLTEEMLEDAVAGRGLHVDGQGRLFLPRASLAYYLQDPERWFRAWLSQTAFSQFVVGDFEAFSKQKHAAWSTVLRLVLLWRCGHPILFDDLFGELRVFGVHADYWNFKEAETDWVEQALANLEAQRSIVREGAKVFPRMDVLANWERCHAASLRSGSLRRANYLFDVTATQEISAFALLRWNVLGSRDREVRQSDK